ncbi:MAG TPA: hypothetical protein DCZ84_00940 [Candidatus Vogelbacteria bacterium]|uniref:EamA domain-containing protein n=1 Tax=Candidatus Vogelbacteria bacterium RIFOXYD1_FULL_51_18 TaxID=1802440 RepID=A0A1G2QIZ9_9BACT|nr:MAG: hypothetical protein UY66_C0004G0025 [Parcubacteria group bacterium GW2011_GWC1_51_35]KKW27354.1 MAG: hypothetical protein UY69_C0014G0004 [Parcubacteria group bacterium GW2011_GWF1_52_5]OHA60634.1 MAG: hypothetical protein A2569_00980 [Candidatus Vogelbacteria bacterium RIFOXYD1_FULL_51_18]HBB65191.1 hypothetical protein [Candidatus Vogelbacteria bacterium]HBC44166.1 hypothetical protein [Candidatus Vogelbacteria bacterium]
MPTQLKQLTNLCLYSSVGNGKIIEKIKKGEPMNSTALMLVLGFCVTEALYNVCITQVTKQKPQLKKRIMTLAGLVGLVATVLLFLVAFITGGMEVTEGWWKPVLITGVLAGGVLFAEFKAFSLEDASLVAPISSTTPALVIVTSFIILGEYPSSAGWVGIQFIVLGTYLLNIQTHLRRCREAGTRITWKDWLAPFIMLAKSKGVRYAYLCVLFAIFSLNYEALAVRKANVAFASACIFGIASLLNLAVASYVEGKITTREVIFLRQPLVLVIATCLFLGIFLSNSAFRYDIVPYVGTLKRLQIPLTILFAWYFLGERENFKGRLFGGSLMAVGAIFIALGG